MEELYLKSNRKLQVFHHACDFFLKAKEGDILEVHQAILYAKSQHFKNFFENEQFNPDFTLFVNIKLATLQNLLIFMYDGEVRINKCDLQDFMNGKEYLGIVDDVIQEDCDANEEDNNKKTKNLSVETLRQDDNQLSQDLEFGEENDNNKIPETINNQNSGQPSTSAIYALEKTVSKLRKVTPKSFVCLICQVYAFTTEQKLMQHIERVHLGFLRIESIHIKEENFET